MGRIVRHGGAPFATGEVVPAQDLEGDIQKAYQEMGSIDDANVDESADIQGSKLAVGSVHGNRLGDAAVTVAHLIDGTVGTDRFADNSLETDRFVANSCSQVQSTVDATTRALANDVWGLLTSRTITTNSSTLGRILVFFQAIWAETANLSQAKWQLRRNGTTVAEWQNIAGAPPFPTHAPIWSMQRIHLDEGLGASTLYTYELYGMDITGLGGQSEVRHSVMSCTEFRR